MRNRQAIGWLFVLAIIVFGGWSLLPGHSAWLVPLRRWMVWRPMVSDWWTLRVAAGLLVLYAAGVGAGGAARFL